MNLDTKRWIFDITVWTTSLVATFVLLASAEASERRSAPASNATWQAECGSCHVAYPPRLLPAASWHAVMNGLDRHFGVNASLDPAVSAEIGSFLQANAGGDRRTAGAAPALRITETRWFAHEHGEIPAAIFARHRLKKSDCGACHVDAAHGVYDERTLNVPR